MTKMRAAVIDHSAPAHVSLAQVNMPIPAPDEALVRVKATSLNLGEVRFAQRRNNGEPIGWDLAGVAERQAADGSGPPAGTRVVGFVPTGAWADFVSVPTNALAILPEDVSFTDAATLPTAGLTALYVLEKGNGLLQRGVLVTGANGGVGLFACQLAKLLGARVVGQVRKKQHVALVEEAGADVVVVTEDGTAVTEFGPYRLIAESVGGPMLANCLRALGPDGVCVSFGNSSGSITSFDASSFYPTPRATLYAFLIFNELRANPASSGLSRLVALLQNDMLRPHINAVEQFDKIGELAQDLWDRKIPGKAVAVL